MPLQNFETATPARRKEITSLIGEAPKEKHQRNRILLTKLLSTERAPELLYKYQQGVFATENTDYVFAITDILNDKETDPAKLKELLNTYIKEGAKNEINLPAVNKGNDLGRSAIVKAIEDMISPSAQNMAETLRELEEISKEIAANTGSNNEAILEKITNFALYNDNGTVFKEGFMKTMQDVLIAPTMELDPNYNDLFSKFSEKSEEFNKKTEEYNKQQNALLYSLKNSKDQIVSFTRQNLEQQMVDFTKFIAKEELEEAGKDLGYAQENLDNFNKSLFARFNGLFSNTRSKLENAVKQAEEKFAPLKAAKEAAEKAEAAPEAEAEDDAPPPPPQRAAAGQNSAEAASPANADKVGFISSLLNAVSRLFSGKPTKPTKTGEPYIVSVTTTTQTTTNQNPSNSKNADLLLANFKDAITKDNELEKNNAANEIEVGADARSSHPNVMKLLKGMDSARHKEVQSGNLNIDEAVGAALNEAIGLERSSEIDDITASLVPPPPTQKKQSAAELGQETEENILSHLDEVQNEAATIKADGKTKAEAAELVDIDLGDPNPEPTPQEPISFVERLGGSRQRTGSFADRVSAEKGQSSGRS